MFKIVERSKIFFSISGIIILLGIIMFCVHGGFAEDVDFAGGMSMYIDMGKEVDLKEVTAAVKEAAPDIANPIVQRSDGFQVVIQTTPVETDVKDKIQSTLLEKFELPAEAVLQVDNVSATVGNELKTQALTATLIAAILMLLYITIRFEFKTGVSAIVALLHDVLIMLSFYAIFQVPINTTFIAAILTIIGYSINNTIVVFDRVRENVKRSRRAPFNETIDNSIKQTLVRSVNTTITTLLPVVMLFIFGVQSIRQFTIPLIVGLLAGTYSSILLAGPTWAGLKKWQDKRKHKKLKTA